MNIQISSKIKFYFGHLVNIATNLIKVKSKITENCKVKNSKYFS